MGAGGRTWCTDLALRRSPRFDARGGVGAETVFGDNLPPEEIHPGAVELCDGLGLCDYWADTGRWPDCVDEVAPAYDFKAAVRDRIAARAGGGPAR